MASRGIFGPILMPGSLSMDNIAAELAISGDQREKAAPYEKAAIYFDLGNRHQQKGDLNQAVACYYKALDIRPGFVGAYNNLGIAFSRMGSNHEAIDCYLTAIKLKPDFAQAYDNLGNLFFDSGAIDKAIACYRKAIDLDRDFAHAYYNLGNAYEAKGSIEQAVGCFKKAQEILPSDPAINFKLALALQKQGQYTLGLNYLDKVQESSPEILAARFFYGLSLPLFYQQESEIKQYRQRYKKGLDEIIATTELRNDNERKAALTALGRFSTFYLAYQGKNDFELQKKFAEFTCRIMAENFPQWTNPIKMAPRLAGEKIRIGFVSAYMHSHTVAKLFLGWIKNLNRDEFQIHCYYLKSKKDHITRVFKMQSDCFHQLSAGVESAAAQIASDHLHILVYPDIGMFAPASQLAALRLAPVQCVGWGHPVTTGLPTMDYFISSDLMEPENAAANYTEKLIRLPGISISYEKPDLPPTPKARCRFGIGQDAFVYLSPQSVFKYLPQYDVLYPKIAQKVPNAKFVFIANESQTVNRQFQKRLSRAFDPFQLDCEKYCVFQPRLGRGDYFSLNLAADVMLDTPGWSGGNTTLEAIGCNLPVVTLPGEFMRGRHSYAMLNILTLDELIAENEDRYIQVAIRLAQDQEFYRRIKERLNLNKNRLFNDHNAVQALEEFFKQQVLLSVKDSQD